MKNKLLFWVFFIILIIINSYLYRLFFMKVKFIPDSLETSVFMPFVIILLYILGVIPFTAYISEELVKFIANQKKATRIVLINAIILTPILVASLMYYNEYKEKGLVEAMDYESDEFEGLMVMGLDIRTTQKEHANEIMEFLSRYNVKKMRDSEWDSFKGEKGISLNIQTEDRPIFTSIFESRLRLNTEYYEVNNGPIDVDWLFNYVESIKTVVN